MHRLQPSRQPHAIAFALCSAAPAWCRLRLTCPPLLLLLVVSRQLFLSRAVTMLITALQHAGPL